MRVGTILFEYPGLQRFPVGKWKILIASVGTLVVNVLRCPYSNFDQVIENAQIHEPSFKEAPPRPWTILVEPIPRSKAIHYTAPRINYAHRVKYMVTYARTENI